MNIDIPCCLHQLKNSDPTQFQCCDCGRITDDQTDAESCSFWVDWMDGLDIEEGYEVDGSGA